ncbi:MAG TPA: hypothetical protein VH681_14540 [Nitrospiraceae bacterium]
MVKRSRYVVTALVVILLIATALHKRLLDGLDGEFLARTLGDTTKYADKYTDHGFRQVHVGMSDAEVRQLVGEPLSESWVYRPEPCDVVFFRNGVVSPFIAKACAEKGITRGLAPPEVIRVLGSTPTKIVWLYSESTSDSHYRERVVELDQNRVSRVIAEFYID